MASEDEPLIGVIEQSTNKCRFLLLNSAGGVVGEKEEEVEVKQPQEGWFEQDPNTIIDMVNKCVKECMDEVKKKRGNVKVGAVGITNQRETTILWDRNTGIPLHNAITWRDGRTAGLATTMINRTTSKNKDEYRSKCGLPIHPYFSALKLRWLIDECKKEGKALDKKAWQFGTVDTWIIWNLTGGKCGGVRVTDVTNASRTMLMNIHTLKWDDDLCKDFEIPKEILPEIRSSSEEYEKIADGPLKGVPLCGCLGDQQAALLGQQCIHPGQAKCTYGAACSLLCNTGEKPVQSSHGLLTTVAYQLGPKEKTVYALEGTVSFGGQLVLWLKEKLSFFEEVAEIEELVNKVEDSGGVCLIPAFTGLFAPHWESDVKGTITGISYNTSKAHLCRAALEALCFHTREMFDALEQDIEGADIEDALKQDIKRNLTKLKVDGEMTANNNMFLQLLREILRMTVERPKIPYMTVIGAAVAANMAVNVWGDTSCLSTSYTSVEPLPILSRNDLNKKYGQWKEAVEWSMQKLHIRGADIIAKTTVEVTPGKLRDYKWNGHGFGLLIPDGALPPDSSTLTMTIQASLSGQYRFPDDTELVSGIYWVACPRKFSQRVTLKLQHCAYLEHPDQLSSLFFITAKCTQKTLPYQFQPLPGGVFSVNSSYGAIELSHFSGIGVGRKKKKRKRYTGQIFYIPQATIMTWLMHFIIICDLKLIVKEVEEFYLAKGAEAGPYLEVIFEEDEVSLDIPKDGVVLSSGWSLRPLVYPTKLLRESVDSYFPGRRIPACQIRLVWSKAQEPPKELFYMIHVSGVIPPDTHIGISRDPLFNGNTPLIGATQEFGTSTQQRVRTPTTPSSASVPSPEQPDSQPHATAAQKLKKEREDTPQLAEAPKVNDFRDFGKPTPEQLMNLVGCKVKNKWHAIGTGLKVKEADLTSIQVEEAGKDDAIQHCMRRIFHKWESAMTSDYTWQNLANVLESPSVDEKAAVVELHKSLCEHYKPN